MGSLRRIPRTSEKDYPRVASPLESVSAVNGNSLKTTFRGHIIVDKSSGIFLETEFDSESDALINSAEYVVNMRKNDNN